MMWQNYQAMMFNPFGAAFGFFLLPLLIWSLAWKGLALWHAARRNEPYWFVALLVINTAGILEFLYLYAFGGINDHPVKS